MPRGTASEDKLYKIGEVCRMADVQPYVLRYWETEFPQLAPEKSGGGQRLYNRAEIDVILRIKELLYRDGFTIAGAKKKLELEQSEPPAGAASPASPAPAAPAARSVPPKADRRMKKAIAEARRELADILRMLEE